MPMLIEGYAQRTGHIKTIASRPERPEMRPFQRPFPGQINCISSTGDGQPSRLRTRNFSRLQGVKLQR